MLVWEAAGKGALGVVAAKKLLASVGTVTRNVDGAIRAEGDIEPELRDEIRKALRASSLDFDYLGGVLRYREQPSAEVLQAIVTPIMDRVPDDFDGRERAAKLVEQMFARIVPSALVHDESDLQLHHHRASRAEVISAIESAIDEGAEGIVERVAAVFQEQFGDVRQHLLGGASPVGPVVDEDTGVVLGAAEINTRLRDRAFEEAGPEAAAWVVALLEERGRSALDEEIVDLPSELPQFDVRRLLARICVVEARWASAALHATAAARIGDGENARGSLLTLAIMAARHHGDLDLVSALQCELQETAPESEAATLDRLSDMASEDMYTAGTLLEFTGRSERTRLASLLSLISMEAERFADAATHAADAVTADPLDIGARALRPQIGLHSLIRQRRRGLVDGERARATAELFASLVDEAQSRDLLSEGVFRVYQMDALFAGDFDDDALGLLRSDRLRECAARYAGVAHMAARVAVMNQETELALELLPEEGEAFDDGLTRANVLLHSTDPSVVSDAVHELESILDGHRHELKPSAASALLHRDGPWHERASDYMSKHHPIAWTLARAQYLARTGDFEGAENVLLASLPDLDVQRALVLVAEQRGDYDVALKRSATLAEARPTPQNRLRLAVNAARAGEHERSTTVLEQISMDTAVSAPIRARAAERLADQLHDQGDFAGYQRVAERWFALAPDNPNARWSKVYAALLTDDDEAARRIVADLDLDPQNPGQAKIYVAALDRDDAQPDLVSRAAEISERLGFVEELERFVISRGLVAEDERSRQLALDAAKAFPDRFDGATVLQEVQIDTSSAESIDSFFKQFAGGEERQVFQIKTQQEIVAGTQFMAVLADLSSRDIGEIWDRASAWPLRYANDEIRSLERDAVVAALGTGAVLEPSAIAVLGMLDSKIGDALLLLLGRTMVTRETLLEFQTARQKMNQDTAPVGEGGFDHQTGRAFTIMFTPEQLKERQVRSSRRASIAEAVEQVGVDRTKLEDHEREALDNASASIDALTSSLLVAKQRKLPLYCDDRYVRLFVRFEGLVAFGTIDLIEVGLSRGLVSDEQATAVLDLLRSVD